MQLQRRQFLQATAALAVTAALPAIAAEPWQLSAIENAAKLVAENLRVRGMVPSVIPDVVDGEKPAFYFSPEFGNTVMLDNWFTSAFSVEPGDEHVLYANYLQPIALMFIRGNQRIARSRALNALAGDSDLSTPLGAIAGNYDAKYMGEISVRPEPNIGRGGLTEQQVSLDGVRYGIIESILNDHRIFLDRPLDVPLHDGQFMRGGWQDKEVLFNDAARVVSAPLKGYQSVTADGVCLSYEIDGRTILLSMMSGVLVDAGKCQLTTVNGFADEMDRRAALV